MSRCRTPSSAGETSGPAPELAGREHAALNADREQAPLNIGDLWLLLFSADRGYGRTVTATTRLPRETPLQAAAPRGLTLPAAMHRRRTNRVTPRGDGAPAVFQPLDR